MSEDLSSVCMVSVGARTALGATAEASAAAVRGAISGRAEHPFMIDKAGEPMYIARDTLLPVELRGQERLGALARSALEDALAPIEATRIPCIFGCAESRPGQTRDLQDGLAHELDRAFSPRISLSDGGVIAQGHASGVFAIDAAARRIQQGKCELCVAGGIDSWLDPETLEWLDETGALSSSENRSGFTPGEAAGFCVLADEQTAMRRQLPILCRLKGVGTAWEENGIHSEGICVGRGMAEAVRGACNPLALPGEKVNFVYCDLNGQRYRSEEFTFMSLRTQAYFAELSDSLTPADCWGDIGAASAPLFATLAIAASERGYARGPRVVLWTGSESGHRAALRLELPVRSPED